MWRGSSTFSTAPFGRRIVFPPPSSRSNSAPMKNFSGKTKKRTTKRSAPLSATVGGSSRPELRQVAEVLGHRRQRDRAIDGVECFPRLGDRPPAVDQIERLVGVVAAGCPQSGEFQQGGRGELLRLGVVLEVVIPEAGHPTLG